MPVRRFSISVSPELAQALEALSHEADADRSRLIETLLRENPLVAAAVARLRGLPTGPQTKKGRSIEKLLLLAQVSRAQWDERLRSGQVKILGPSP